MLDNVQTIFKLQEDFRNIMNASQAHFLSKLNLLFEQDSDPLLDQIVQRGEEIPTDSNQDLFKSI